MRGRNVVKIAPHLHALPACARGSELLANKLSGPLPSTWGCKDCFKSLQEM